MWNGSTWPNTSSFHRLVLLIGSDTPAPTAAAIHVPLPDAVAIGSSRFVLAKPRSSLYSASTATVPSKLICSPTTRSRSTAAAGAAITGVVAVTAGAGPITSTRSS